MKAATRDWIKKAEGDWLAALALSRRRKVPLHDQVQLFQVMGLWRGDAGLFVVRKEVRLSLGLRG